MSESPRVFATRALSAAVPAARQALEQLDRHCEVDAWSAYEKPSPEEFSARASAAEGLLCLLTDRIDAALLDRCPRLRAISSVSVGVDSNPDANRSPGCARCICSSSTSRAVTASIRFDSREISTWGRRTRAAVSRASGEISVARQI